VIDLALGTPRELNTDKVLDIFIWLKVFANSNETNSGFFPYLSLALQLSLVQYDVSFLG